MIWEVKAQRERQNNCQQWIWARTELFHLIFIALGTAPTQGSEVQFKGYSFLTGRISTFRDQTSQPAQ